MAIFKVYLKPGLWKRGTIEYPSHSNIGDIKAIKNAESGRLRGIGEPIAYPMDDETVAHFIDLGIVEGFMGKAPSYWADLNDPKSRYDRQTQRLRRRLELGIATDEESTELQKRETKAKKRAASKKTNSEPGAKKKK